MFFDIHAHVYRYPFPSGDYMLFMTEEELRAHHREYGIDGAVLLPVVSSEVYMPQSVGEIIDIAARSGGRCLPFCNIDPRVLTNTSDAPIGRLLEFYQRQGCRGVGEVMPNLPWSDARVQNLLRCVEQAGLPLLFDMTGRLNTSYGIYDEPGMPQFESCLRRFPKLTFIGHGPAFWAEIAALRRPEDRYGYPSYPVEREGRVAELMRTYPNLWADLSAGSGANAMMRDPEYAVNFLREFSDRVLFGTDTCYAGQPLPIAGFLQGLYADGRLSDAVFRGIAKGNAFRLLHISELPEQADRGKTAYGADTGS